MKRTQRQQKLVAEINITPFTDVILVLLVIFMITTPLIYQSNIKVDLPKAKSAQQESSARKAYTYITITEKGFVYLDERMVTRRELRSRIEALHKNNPALSIVLRADKTVPFKDIVEVLDIMAEFGITKFNIAATTENNGK
jgi:biopolymer transport protein ExbD